MREGYMVKGGKFQRRSNGDKHFLVGKQTYKIDRGKTRWVPPSKGSIT
jgi:hypothetical protein